jgi:hypothetical protein
MNCATPAAILSILGVRGGDEIVREVKPIRKTKLQHKGPLQSVRSMMMTGEMINIDPADALLMYPTLSPKYHASHTLLHRTIIGASILRPLVLITPTRTQ